MTALETTKNALIANIELKKWLHGLAPWSHAVTLTFKRHINQREVINESIMVDTIRHYLYVINRKFFSRKQISTGCVVPSLVVIGWGANGRNPHAHLALASPNLTSFDEFSCLLEATANKLSWLAREKCIKTYRDQGWSNYLIDNHKLIYSLLQPYPSHQVKNPA